MRAALPLRAYGQVQVGHPLVAVLRSNIPPAELELLAWREHDDRADFVHREQMTMRQVVVDTSSAPSARACM